MTNIEIELEFYSRNPDKLKVAKRHIVRMYGEDTYMLFLQKILPKKRVKSKRMKDLASYRRRVRKLTELEPLHVLEGYELRSFWGMHVDHIVSIKDAYNMGWSEDMCASIKNLRVITREENLLKGQKSVGHHAKIKE